MSAILFDRDQVDHLDDLSDRPGRLRGSKLLWVDLHDGSEFSAAEVAEELDLRRETRRCLATPNEKACFNDYGRYIHITTYAPHEDEEGELHAVECVVGENWVVTAHDRPIPVLDEFADRVSGSGDTGSLDGPSFLAALLEWVLGAYTAAFERIEQRLEEFDVHAMRGEGADKDIELLIDMRREVGSLRRALAAHRSALVALTHPELEALGNKGSGERFESLFTPLRGDAARSPRCPRGDRRLLRRPDREGRPPHKPDHESAHSYFGDPAPGRTARRRDGHELQSRPLRQPDRSSGSSSP